MIRMPGAFSFAVATPAVKPKRVMRSRARSAMDLLMPKGQMPGAHLSRIAVAKASMKPILAMRPRALGQSRIDALARHAGRAPITNCGRQSFNEAHMADATARVRPLAG